MSQKGQQTVQASGMWGLAFVYDRYEKLRVAFPSYFLGLSLISPLVAFYFMDARHRASLTPVPDSALLRGLSPVAT